MYRPVVDRIIRIYIRYSRNLNYHPLKIQKLFLEVCTSSPLTVYNIYLILLRINAIKKIIV